MPSTAFPARLRALLVFAVASSSCTVGPNYRGAPPVAAEAAHAATFVRAPSAGIAATHAPSRWWATLGDAQLDMLIDAALAHNPTVQAAQARLRESRAQLQQQEAGTLPKISANAAVPRLREPDVSGLGTTQGDDTSSTPTDRSRGRGPLQLYTAGFDASWEIDVFGGTRRAVEAAGADAEAVEADLADAQVSLAAEVAQAYVGLRDQQQRLVLAKQSAGFDQQMLELTRQRRARGVGAEADVERLTTQVETTRATLIPLDEQITESLDQLAVLTGQAPGELDDELTATAPLPNMPAEVPIGDPASLLRQRPDVRAAERRIAASNAQIGERTADLFPKVSLLGYVGSTAADAGHLLKESSFTWLGVPYLQWNVFDFGRTRSSIRQAEAGRDEAEARYAHSVLGALQDANNALSRYGHQRESVARLQQIRASADRSAVLMRQRYGAGASSLIDLLDTQRTQATAQQNLAAGQADLLKDFVSLQKSLGLGWLASTE